MKSLEELNAIVLHRVVNHSPIDFTDIRLETLKFILSKSSYNFVSIDEAFQNHFQDGSSICLTFDDGFSSDYDLVLPELKRINSKATFFIVTDFLDTPRYLTTMQVKILSENGMQIGSHSKSHPNFLSLTSSERINELHTSKVILEEIIGKEVTAFSFPFGCYDEKCAEAVFSSGYNICCTSQHGISLRSNAMMPRNSINAKTSFKRIEKILDPTIGQRLCWYIEDIVKAILKRWFPKLYLVLRNLFSSA
ncbi:polysaccharide deacetylase family protein [Alphaproteobacteria bacterium]|nr:polysaccharide deacetylase family protein [Alphaproteobacteria bacterium]